MSTKKKTVCIVGKGHSGTRLFADTLDQSGIFMGKGVKRRHRTMKNFTHIRSAWKFVPDTMDKGPYENILNICKLSAPLVSQKSFSEWDFSKLVEGNIPDEVHKLYHEYLRDLKESDNNFTGWKMTESSLFYPWTVRMFPDWHYIHIVRDVRSHMFRIEGADRMPHTKIFNNDVPKGIPRKSNGDLRDDIQIALNWKYNLDLINSLPRPKKFLRVRFEDFLTNQDFELERMSRFLDKKLIKLPVHPEKATRWKDELKRGSADLGKNKKDPKNYWVPKTKIDKDSCSFLDNYMKELKYNNWFDNE